MSAPNRPPITKVYSRRQQPPGKRSCTYPIASVVSYDQLSYPTCSFVKSLDFISIPKTIQEALSYFGWRNTIIKEVNALDDNGYAQRYRVDYFDTFSPVAKLNSITLFISMVASQD
ncbi:Cysteine-rich RLK (RECEPTOR-like protein kinase) 8 [Cucumis melo var. makuwa]|uniref:Cysteine-rich RLK (RECEPTOR-like protein kinase) 8 n=1 Tax=Cucumis melo var. makuwa TaxID=1194695 RepID=A0A5A7V8I2_CUCMM|nr:Cysteine-rich RLK (RECEPTOR-like protein kinase) 8 [Cucumis melo var. makuwa]